MKYPHIEDYAVRKLKIPYFLLLIAPDQLSLMEHDEKQHYMARQHLMDIRNVYAVVTDIIHKNIAKVRETLIHENNFQQ